MKALIITGVILLLLSIHWVWRFMELTEVYRYTISRFELSTISEIRDVSFFGHSISLRDAIPVGNYGEGERVKGRINIIVDGKDFSIGSDVIIRPKFHNENRYFTWLSIVQLKNKKTGKSFIAIVQRIDDLLDDRFGDLSKMKFRILYVMESGEVTEETFCYKDREKPPYRSALVTDVSPSIEMYYPNWIVPIIYPGLSSIVGIMLLGIGLRKFKTR